MVVVVGLVVVVVVVVVEVLSGSSVAFFLFVMMLCLWVIFVDACHDVVQRAKNGSNDAECQLLSKTPIS